MIPIASSEEIKEIDRLSINEWGIPSLALMETAAFAVLQTIKHIVSTLDHKSILIVCGKGNNAGDGFALARQLINKKAKVEIIYSHSSHEMSHEAQANFKFLEKMNATMSLFSNIEQRKTNQKYDLIIDALLGTGIKGNVTGVLGQMIDFINQVKSPTLSIDLPSGMNANISKIEGPCVKANYTLCIGLPKPAIYFEPSKSCAGIINHDTIGFPKPLLKTQQYLVENLSTKDLPQRTKDSHKSNSGKLLIFAGSLGMAGAAILTAISALKSGTGMVQIATTKDLSYIFQVALPEVMVLILEEDNNSIQLDSAINVILKRTRDWSNALVVGPGLGTNSNIKCIVKELLKKVEQPILLDADGINAISENLEIIKERTHPLIITPHIGEFKRVFKQTPAPEGLPRIEQCRQLSENFGITLHLKGAPSLTACSNSNVYINGTGNSILSTAGSGDVLSGLTGSFLAQGLSPDNAMLSASFWHGKSADDLLNKKGPIGHTAKDIANNLPIVLND